MANSSLTIGQATTPWLVCPKPNPNASLRLFCFPYAGGRASIFWTWPDILPTTVEVCAVELPGRGTRLKEAPCTQISPLVQAITQSIVAYLDKPFSFFGHSMGAKCSFNVARQLRSEYGVEPVHLFVSGCSAPQITDPSPLTYDLPEPEFLEELRRLNGTPQEVLENPELLRLMLPILRADFELVQTYEYMVESPLSCPITAYGGLQDEDVSREDLEGWQEQTTDSFVLRVFPGDHFFLHTAQQLFLRSLSQDLNQLVSKITERTKDRPLSGFTPRKIESAPLG